MLKHLQSVLRIMPGTDSDRLTGYIKTPNIMRYKDKAVQLSLRGCTVRRRPSDRVYKNAQTYKTANLLTAGDGCINSVEARHCLVSRSDSKAFDRVNDFHF